MNYPFYTSMCVHTHTVKKTIKRSLGRESTRLLLWHFCSHGSLEDRGQSPTPGSDNLL